MKDRIIVCGLNGSGKSTVGRLLAEKLGYPFRDIEEYWFPNRLPDAPYAAPHTQEQVERALLRDLRAMDRLVLASVRGGYSAETDLLFTRAVCLEAPKPLRMQRIRERSQRKFGERMLPGGDLYESEEAFFRMTEARSETFVRDWLDSAGLPVLFADGTLPPDTNALLLARWLTNTNL